MLIYSPCISGKRPTREFFVYSGFVPLPNPSKRNGNGKALSSIALAPLGNPHDRRSVVVALLKTDPLLIAKNLVLIKVS